MLDIDCLQKEIAMHNVQSKNGSFVLICDDCHEQLTDEDPGRLHWAEVQECSSQPALRLCAVCFSWRQRGLTDSMEKLLEASTAA